MSNHTVRDLKYIINKYNENAKKNNETLIKDKTIACLIRNFEKNHDVIKTISDHCWRASYKLSDKIDVKLLKIANDYFDMVGKNLKFTFAELPQPNKVKMKKEKIVYDYADDESFFSSKVSFYTDVDTESYNETKEYEITPFDDYIIDQMLEACANADVTENFKMRKIMVMNLYAMGVDHNMVYKIVSKQVVKHRPDENPPSVISWIRSKFPNSEEEFEITWNDDIFKNQHGQAKLFPFDERVRSLLANETLTIRQLSLLLKHLFVIIDNHIVYLKFDGKGFSKLISFPQINNKIFAKTIKVCMGKDRVKQFNLSNLIDSINSCEDYSSYNVGLTEEHDPNSVYDLCVHRYHNGSTKSFNDRPKAIDWLLHAFLDNNECGFTQDELNERVNVFETYIAYKLQHPAVHIGLSFVIQTNPGVGKSTYAKILSKMTSQIMDNADLNKELQHFNAVYLDKIIVFYNEVSLNASACNAMKKLVSEDKKTIEYKGGETLEVSNSSLKILLTTDADLKFIEPDDRHFIVLSGTNKQSDVKDKFLEENFIYSNVHESFLNQDLIAEYKDYLLNLAIPNDFIPAVFPTSRALNENKHSALDRRENEQEVLSSFLLELKNHIHLPTMKENGKLCVTSAHVEKIMYCLQKYRRLHVNTISEKDRMLFKNEESLNTMSERYRTDYQIEIHWSARKISDLLLLDKYNFSYKRNYIKNSLELSEVIDDLYPLRPNIFIFKSA